MRNTATQPCNITANTSIVTDGILTCTQCAEEKKDSTNSYWDFFNDMYRLLFSEKNSVTPTRIIRSGIATIVLWEDGTKTIVKRSDDTEDDPYAAFCIALAKKIYGSNSAVKRIIERKTTIRNIKKEI